MTLKKTLYISCLILALLVLPTQSISQSVLFDLIAPTGQSQSNLPNDNQRLNGHDQRNTTCEIKSAELILVSFGIPSMGTSETRNSYPLKKNGTVSYSTDFSAAELRFVTTGTVTIKIVDRSGNVICQKSASAGRELYINANEFHLRDDGRGSPGPDSVLNEATVYLYCSGNMIAQYKIQALGTVYFR